MPADWKWSKLGSTAHVEMGQSPPGNLVHEGRDGIPFLQGNAEFGSVHPTARLSSSRQFKMAARGDALISVRAPVGALNMADQAYCIGRGLAAIRFQGLHSRFGYHALSVYTAPLRRLSQGSTFEAVGGEDLRGLRVPVPEPGEQGRIADILDELDDAIGATDRIIVKLESVKRGLLHDLLTCGVDGNGEIRDSARHPGQFKDSPLGSIPNTWDCVALREVLASTDYGISSSLSTQGEVPVLRMMNLREGEAAVGDLKFASRTSVTGLLLRAGDVLFNRTNSIEHVGRTGIWRGQLTEASFASYLVRLNPNRSRLENEYLNLWLNLPRTNIHVKRFATPGVQQVNVNPTNLRRVLIALPRDASEQIAVSTKYAEARAAVTSERRVREKLQFLRRGLAADLLTGRVRVAVPSGAAA